MDEVVIEPARPDDQPFVAEMVVLTTEHIEAEARRDRGERLTMARLEVSQWQTDRYHTFVAWQHGERVGAVWLRGTGERSAQIYTLGLAVVPAHQRHGIGSTLMQYALDYCRRHGGYDLRLYVHPDNEAALGLYRRFGFEPIRIEMRLKL